MKTTNHSDYYSPRRSLNAVVVLWQVDDCCLTTTIDPVGGAGVPMGKGRRKMMARGSVTVPSATTASSSVGSLVGVYTVQSGLGEK